MEVGLFGGRSVWRSVCLEVGLFGGRSVWKSASLKKYEALKTYDLSSKSFTSKRNYDENFRAKESKYDANFHHSCVLR